jgi:hypothetical protein
MNTVDDLIARARERAGLHDLGTESFHDGLVALVDGADAAGTFNELGIAVVHDQAIGILANRLRIEDRYHRHPEIDEQVISPPLFGLGLPRTGSTALSYLQAEDPATRSLRTWETNSPAPPPDPATEADDPRIAEAEVQISLIDDLAPKFKVMLPQSPTGPNECLQFMCLDFRSAMFAALGDNEPYAEWFDSCDMVSTYRYHERVLKLLQWKYPPRPWRLKSPAHMHSLDALLEVYPDARFVMTHRDIAQVIPSVVSLLDATSEMLREGELAPDFAQRQAGFWERSVRRTLTYRDAGNEDRFFDISFTAMRTDPVSEMERLYGWRGDELTEEVRERMSIWWTTNPRDKQGVHEYRPEQYGIDLDELREQFAFYNDRFVESAKSTTTTKEA